MVVKYVIALIALAVLMLSPVSRSEDLLFVGSQFPSILELKNDGSVTGVAVELIDQIMSGTKQPYQIVVIPWKRAQTMLLEGEADMLIGPYKTAERQRFLDYVSTPFYIDQMVLYTWQGNTVDWQGDFTSLQRKLLGIPLGWTGGISFESAKSKLRIYEVPELTNGLEMLVRKRLDIVLSNRRNALADIRNLNIAEKVVMLMPIVQTIKGYFAFSRQREIESVKRLFEQQLETMAAKGLIQSINQKYGLDYNNS